MFPVYVRLKSADFKDEVNKYFNPETPIADTFPYDRTLLRHAEYKDKLFRLVDKWFLVSFPDQAISNNPDQFPYVTVTALSNTTLSSGYRSWNNIELAAITRKDELYKSSIVLSSKVANKVSMNQFLSFILEREFPAQALTICYNYGRKWDEIRIKQIP